MKNIVIIDIITVFIIAGMAIWGLKSGFITTVFKFGYFIVAAIVAAVAYPIVSSALLNTPLAGGIRDRLAERIAMQGASVVDFEALPAFLATPISDRIDSTTQAMATSITQTIVSMLSIIAVFLIVRFGLKLIVKMLNIVASLPVITVFNKTGGFVIGILNGFVMVYLLLAVATVFVSSPIVKLISSATLTGNLYRNNLLLQLILR